VLKITTDIGYGCRYFTFEFSFFRGTQNCQQCYCSDNSCIIIIIIIIIFFNKMLTKRSKYTMRKIPALAQIIVMQVNVKLK